ncbi:MAG: hypothetical protein NXI20_02105 [bacterium]|nr:hypothetical protein [bacterium]
MKVLLFSSEKDKELKELILQSFSNKSVQIIDFNPDSSKLSLEDNVQEQVKMTDGVIIIIKTKFNKSEKEQTLAEIVSSYQTAGKFILPLVFEPDNTPSILDPYQAVDGDENKVSENIAIAVQIMSARIAKRIQNLKDEEVQKETIKGNLTIYVDPVLKSLRRKELINKGIGIFCHILGLLAILSPLYYVSETHMNAIEFKDNDLLKFLFFTITGAIGIAVLLAASRYVFNIGKAFMHEAVKIGDRIHAISYGKLYIELFKDSISPKEIMEVFKDWNIEQTKSFIQLDSNDFDPKILTHLSELGKIAGSKKEKK